MAERRKINNFDFINQDSGKDDWGTPKKLFEYLDKEWHFELDPCANDRNHLCEKYYTKAEDGLSQDWEGKRVYMNPPYGRETGKWIEKAYRESVKGASVVCLIPARPDTSYWHNWIFPYASKIQFIQGRLHYSDGKEGCPFPSAIVIFQCSSQGGYNDMAFEKKGGEFYVGNRA
ncbi:MAG: hypothetical protein IJI57_04955 [Flexilinea sp.]|nr:hypothetical protein [Flexilinea sp.]